MRAKWIVLAASLIVVAMLGARLLHIGSSESEWAVPPDYIGQIDSNEATRTTAWGQMGWGEYSGMTRSIVGMGESFTVGGVECEVIEVARSTNGDGEVGFSESDVNLTVEKSSGVALADVSDSKFTAFVLRQREQGEWGEHYALGVHHPGIGLRIGPSPPSEKPISATLVMGYACPTITIKENAVAQEGALVSFVLHRRSIEDNLVEHWIGADKFKILDPETRTDTGERDDQWKTDVNGIVRENLGDGTGLRQIYFATGEEAITQRRTDLRDEQAEEPEEYAVDLWCYYKGYAVRVVEGEDVELDLPQTELEISGDAGGYAFAWLENCEEPSPGAPYGTVWDRIVLDGGGKGTMTGLMPGRWVILQRPTEDAAPWESISERSLVIIPDDGAKVQVTLDPLSAPPSDKRIYIYDENATLISAEVYDGDPPCDLLATGSKVDVACNNAVIKTDDTGFWLDGTMGDGCYEVVLRGRQIYVGSENAAGIPASVWWDGEDAHDNIPAPGEKDELTAWILREKSSLQPDAAFQIIPGGIRSEPVFDHPAPTLNEEPPAEWAWPDAYEWEIVKADGSTENAGRKTGRGLYDGDQVEFDQPMASYLKWPLLFGGKLHGNCVDGDEQAITREGMPEAYRMGLEWGGWHPQTEIRIIINDEAGADELGARASRLGNVCPYCLGPVWRWPSTGSYYYGYCTQALCHCDARTYLRTPTVAAGSYDVRVVSYGIDKRRQVRLVKWLRPVKYLETEPYLVEDYAGLGLPRWVFQHGVLGQWEGFFSDAQTCVEIATALGLTDALYLQPKILPNPRVIFTGIFDIMVTLAGGAARTWRTIVRPESQPQHMVRARKTAAAEEGASAAEFLFISDVADVEWVAGAMANSIIPFLIVGDNPGLVWAQTPIEDCAQTPWACQFLARFGNPHLDVDLAGRTWLAFEDQGEIRVYHRDSPQRPWEQHTSAFAQAHHDACITCRNDGRLQVMATLDEGFTQFVESWDDGHTWAAPS